MTIDFPGIFSKYLKERSTEYLKFELKELESLFGMVLFSSFLGYPSPPHFLALKLLPHLERELKAVMERHFREDDLFGELLGLLDIG